MKSLITCGEYAKAGEHFQSAIARHPTNPKIYLACAKAHEEQGRHAAAAAVYTEASRNNPSTLGYFHKAANAWRAADNLEKCVTILDRILATNPNEIYSLNLLAWIRATAPDPSLRDADQAVRLADLACSLTGHRDPATLDTLAAAYATSERFDDALATLAKMLSLTQGLAANHAKKAKDIYELRATSYNNEQPLSAPGEKLFLELAAE